MAKNAAIVSISTCFGTYPKTYPSKGDPNYGWTRISNDKWEDIPPVHNYVDRMIEDIHCEGSLVLFGGNTGGGGGGGMPSGASGQGGMPSGGAEPQTQASRTVEDIAKDHTQRILDRVSGLMP